MEQRNKHLPELVTGSNVQLCVTTTGFDSSWLLASLAFVDLRDGRPVCVVRNLLSIDVGSWIDSASASSISVRSESSSRFPITSSYSSMTTSGSSVILSIFSSISGLVFFFIRQLNELHKA